MSVVIDYTVTLTPAKHKNDTWSFVICDPASKTYKLSTATVSGLVSEICRMAQGEFRQSCAVSVRLPRDVRKPRGFDAAMRDIRFIAVTAEGSSK